MFTNTHKLAQYERRVVSLTLGDHELHGGGIHAITKRGDHGEIGNREERIEFIFFQGLVAVKDWR